MKVPLRLSGLVAGMWPRLSSLRASRGTGWKACVTFFFLAAVAWGQVGETLVRLHGPAAGKFPSGKRLLASNGFSYRTSEIGLSECLPAVSFPP